MVVVQVLHRPAAGQPFHQKLNAEARAFQGRFAAEDVRVAADECLPSHRTNVFCQFVYLPTLELTISSKDKRDAVS